MTDNSVVPLSATMDQIFHAYSALNADIQEEMKLYIFYFLQMENETTEDLEILTKLLNILKSTDTSENNCGIVLKNSSEAQRAGVT